MDNTFATPYLQQPLALGPLMAVNSLSEYLGGHSDMIGGAVLTGDGDLADESLERAKRFCESTRVFALAEPLGRVESLIEHPAIMTHASIPREVREASGLRDSLIRLSVGVEDGEDLLGDIRQAPDTAHG